MDGFLEFIRFEAWRDVALAWSGQALTALAVLVVGLMVAGWLARTVRRTIERRGGDAVLANFARKTVFAILLIVVVVGALDKIGVPTASMLAALGAAGLAIGLALKDSLGNLASGVLLIVTRPFRAGDYVEAAGQGGTVDKVELLQTILVTPDNCEVTLPNAQVMSEPIVNYSARPQRRLDLPVSIAYEDDVGEALKVIRATLGRDPRVLSDPEPQMLVMSLAESGIDLSVRPWVKSSDYWPARSDLLAAIKAALDEAGITIPYPQQVMRMVAPEEPGDKSADAA